MIIDLSVELNEDTPVYPGDPKTSIKPAGRLDKDGFNDHLLSLGTHVGTHIDAPIHMIEGGKTIDQYKIEHFVGRGRYIDARDGFELGKFQQAEIAEGDIVLIHTGLADNYAGNTYFTEYEAIPDEVADFLIDSKPKIVGLDMCSPDHEPFSIHKKLLAKDILIVENMTNLGTLKGREFKVYALPLKLDIDAAPIRVIAVIE